MVQEASASGAPSTSSARTTSAPCTCESHFGAEGTSCPTIVRFMRTQASASPTWGPTFRPIMPSGPLETPPVRQVKIPFTLGDVPSGHSARMSSNSGFSQLSMFFPLRPRLQRTARSTKSFSKTVTGRSIGPNPMSSIRFAMSSSGSTNHSRYSPVTGCRKPRREAWSAWR